MYLHIDTKKISYDELRKLLFLYGYFKTSSRRYRRFEKSITSDEYEGIEVEIYSNFMVLSSYYTASLGFGRHYAIEDVLKQYRYRG